MVVHARCAVRIFKTGGGPGVVFATRFLNVEIGFVWVQMLSEQVVVLAALITAVLVNLEPRSVLGPLEHRGSSDNVTGLGRSHCAAGAWIWAAEGCEDHAFQLIAAIPHDVVEQLKHHFRVACVVPLACFAATRALGDSPHAESIAWFHLRCEFGILAHEGVADFKKGCSDLDVDVHIGFQVGAEDVGIELGDHPFNVVRKGVFIKTVKGVMLGFACHQLV